MPKRIAVIIEGRVAYERSVLLGIRDFTAGRPDWILRLELPGRQVRRFLKEWKPDGILFQAAGLTTASIEAIVGSRIPAIQVSDSRHSVSAPSVGLDNRIIGQVAAEYLSDRGFERFGFVGIKGIGFSRTRQEAFCAALGRQKQQANVINLPGTFAGLDLKTERQLRLWLKELPKPCGLFAVHDECSIIVATLAREEGIRVPEDVAILGSDDDSLMCELAWPQLSSIAVPARQVGQVAAERLDAWLVAGRRASLRRPVLLPPQGVVTRQSTDVYRTGDEAVNRVLRYIGAEFHRRLNIESIAREIGMSRRLIERRFRQHLGRTPLEELHRRRIAYARHLLTSTGDNLPMIAERCGFTDASQFVNVFKRQMGDTPGRFRRQARRS